MEDIYKEVYFNKYCETCDDCLAEPMNAESEKPVYWKEKKND